MRCALRVRRRSRLLEDIDRCARPCSARRTPASAAMPAPTPVPALAHGVHRARCQRPPARAENGNGAGGDGVARQDGKGVDARRRRVRAHAHAAAMSCGPLTLRSHSLISAAKRTQSLQSRPARASCVRWAQEERFFLQEFMSGMRVPECTRGRGDGIYAVQAPLAPRGCRLVALKPHTHEFILSSHQRIRLYLGLGNLL